MSSWVNPNETRCCRNRCLSDGLYPFFTAVMVAVLSSPTSVRSGLLRISSSSPCAGIISSRAPRAIDVISASCV